jgi:hypothetical protein
MNHGSAASVAVVLTLFPAVALSADPDGRSGPLYDAIVAQDAAFFTAFNTCKVDVLRPMVAVDLKFFHDRNGLDLGRDVFLKAVAENVCGKFTRELVPGSVEVWPIPNYGAIELGTHKFIHPDRAKNPDGIGKFLILWKQEGDRWVMVEAYSYAHMLAPK